MRRWTVSLAALALLALLLAPVATAQDEELDSAEVAGQGWIVALGNGVAQLEGSGLLHVVGRGKLMLRTSGDDVVQVIGAGERDVLSDGTIVYQSDGFGHAFVSGTDVFVALEGQDIQLRALGNGAVTLIGSGGYRTNSVSGEWSAEGVTLTLGE
jgi:hypothetical protein